MPIPDYQTIMLPLVRFLSDGLERSLRDTISAMADEFDLTDEEHKVLLPSGKQPVINSRVAWAVTYLRQAGLLENIKRGVFKITERGQRVLVDYPERIDNTVLSKFSEFQEFKRRNRKDNASSLPSNIESQDQINPEETLETAYQELKDGLALDLLDVIKSCSSVFFEQLVIDVLIKMGYGGKSGDEGIDGIIKEDKLGLGIIYIQAKRWQGTVGRPEIQKFAGALLGQQAKKGIFITTSSFSTDAENYVKNLDSKIVLIDGQRLAELMVEHNVGVNTVAIYEIKKIDSDYFLEE
jgi:restriction system protein